MLLPLTFLMNPASAMIMLAGIYYGAKYGGSTTSILLNVPGESASVATCIDGYQMARKGRAGAALGIAAIASFIAGTVGVLGLMLIAPPLAQAVARLQLARIFRADGARPRHGGAARRRVDGEGAARHAGRAVARRHRHRPLQPDLALHLRPDGAALGHRLRGGGDRRVRDRRGARQHARARGRAGDRGAQGRCATCCRRCRT